MFCWCRQTLCNALYVYIAGTFILNILPILLRVAHLFRKSAPAKRAVVAIPTGVVLTSAGKKKRFPEKFAEHVLRPYDKYTSREVYVLCSNDETFSKRHDVHTSHLAPERVIQEEKIRAVFITSDNRDETHELTLKALQAGKHVICDTPPFMTAEDVENAQKAGMSNGLIVTGVFQYRFHPLVQFMRNFVQSGRLGTVQHMSVFVWLPGFVKRSHFSALHTVDIVRHLFGRDGEEPRVGAAHYFKKTKTYTADLVYESVRRTGAKQGCGGSYAADARVEFGRGGLKFEASILITGTAGTLSCDNFLFPNLWHTLSFEPCSVASCAGPARPQTWHFYGKDRFATRSSMSYLLDAFADSVLKERSKAIETAVDAVNSQKLVTDIEVASGVALDS